MRSSAGWLDRTRSLTLPPQQPAGRGVAPGCARIGRRAAAQPAGRHRRCEARVAVANCLRSLLRLLTEFVPPFVRPAPPVMPGLESEVCCRASRAQTCVISRLGAQTAGLAVPDLVARSGVGQHHVRRHVACCRPQARQPGVSPCCALFSSAYRDLMLRAFSAPLVPSQVQQVNCGRRCMAGTSLTAARAGPDRACCRLKPRVSLWADALSAA